MRLDQERIRRIQEMLDSEGLEALLCHRTHDMVMLTGYWPVLGQSFAIATRDGKLGVVLPEDEIDLAVASGVDTWESFSTITLQHIQSTYEAALPKISELVKRLQLGSGAIGYADADELYPGGYVSNWTPGQQLADKLRDTLRHNEFHGVSGLLRDQRSVLTRREQQKVRDACTAAKRSYRAIKQVLSVDVKESEIAGAMELHLEIEAKETAGALRSHQQAFCMSGPNAAKAYRSYSQSSPRSLRPGDLALVHLNSCIDGYWTNITRTYLLGEPTHQHLDMYHLILEAHKAALSVVRPGVRASEVDRAAREVIEHGHYGAEFKHGLGHGVGFKAISHGEKPMLHPLSEDILEEGMVLSVAPAIYSGGFGGIRHGSMVLVTNRGAELLTDFDLTLSDLVLPA